MVGEIPGKENDIGGFWKMKKILALLMALVLVLAVWFTYRNRIESMKWLMWAAIISIPLVYICGQAGWIVAEVGRQPWTIQGLLPVNVAISDVSIAAVRTTFFVFLAIFALFLAIEIRIMIGAFKKGPEIESDVESENL